MGAPVKDRSHVVSVYYPVPIVALIEIGAGGEETGEVDLCFLDAAGCEVTLHLTQPAYARLRAQVIDIPK